MTYEDSKKKLENIVSKLDQNKLTLKESLELYEKGIAVAKDCIDSLNEMKGKMEILNADLEKIEVDIEDDE